MQASAVAPSAAAACGQFIRPGDPVVGAEGGGDVEVGEAHADSGFGVRQGIVDPQQPPAPAADMPGQVKGEGSASGRRPAGSAGGPGPARSRGPPGPGRCPAGPGFPRPTTGGAHTSAPVRRRPCNACRPSGAPGAGRQVLQTTSTDSLNMPMGPPGTESGCPSSTAGSTATIRIYLRIIPVYAGPGTKPRSGVDGRKRREQD